LRHLRGLHWLLRRILQRFVRARLGSSRRALEMILSDLQVVLPTNLARIRVLPTHFAHLAAIAKIAIKTRSLRSDNYEGEPRL
jgi:hypothetical protein